MRKTLCYCAWSQRATLELVEVTTLFIFFIAAALTMYNAVFDRSSSAIAFNMLQGHCFTSDGTLAGLCWQIW